MTSLEFNISIFLSTFLGLTKHVISARNNSETAVSLVNYLQNINVSNSLVNLNLNPKYWQTVRKLLGKIHFFTKSGHFWTGSPRKVPGERGKMDKDCAGNANPQISLKKDYTNAHRLPIQNQVFLLIKFRSCDLLMYKERTCFGDLPPVFNQVIVARKLDNWLLSQKYKSMKLAKCRRLKEKSTGSNYR